jgi:hypothetical protein
MYKILEKHKNGELTILFWPDSKKPYKRVLTLEERKMLANVIERLQKI